MKSQDEVTLVSSRENRKMVGMLVEEKERKKKERKKERKGEETREVSVKP